ncbi:hypothetical protein ABIB57_002276 [Devosia sp. UYZn731]|uniref:hypothetical protein n=1 Tax=Devosia sp. UYZn731 TaxID=3156345 RepID=UPI003393EFAF
MTQPNLKPHRVAIYNHLSREIAALNYIRREKPTGALGPTTLSTCNRLIATANRLFRPVPGLPQFAHIDPTSPMTQADLALLTARLTAACFAFEERYRHLVAERQSALGAPAGFPAPTRP